MAATWSLIIGLLLLLLPRGLHGNVYPFGHFFVTMNIGEPLKPYFLDIDTGSNLTWLECHHPVYGCENCNLGPNYYYEPAPSNLKVECQDPFCVALLADLPGMNPKCTREDPHQRHYGIRYVDGTTEGVLSNDTISFSEGNNENIVFGCGYSQKLANPSPVANPTHGILGLGMGTVGFVAQLKAQKVISKDVIGHCLSMIGGGYRFIGDYKLPSTGITWAPMRKYELFYSPGQATLYLDGQQIYANGINLVFDSGATYTYMPAQIYNPLVVKVEAILGDALIKVDDPDLPHCWKQRKSFESFDDAKRGFKPLALRFDSNVIMNIPPRNYLVFTKARNMCLGILNGTQVGQDQRIILGDVTMQDVLVVYDNERGMLGWVNTPCTESAITSRL